MDYEASTVDAVRYCVLSIVQHHIHSLNDVLYTVVIITVTRETEETC